MASTLFTTTINSAQREFETPSKKAAASLESMVLKTPTSAVKSKSLFDKFSDASDDEDDLDDSAACEATGTVEADVEEYRTRFVGDITLDEKDEPLLKPSPRRFVLFPIQYHEVRHCFIRSKHL